MLTDPEAWDDSEEQFESSLISSEQPDCYRSITLGPQRMSTSTAEEDTQSERAERMDRREYRARLDRELSQQAETWRDTLSSRLDKYRNRRGKQRLAGDYTMSLDFERSTHRAVMYSATAPAIEPEPVVDDRVAEEDIPGTAAPSFSEDFVVPGPAASVATAAQIECEPSHSDERATSNADFGLGNETPANSAEAPAPEPPPRKRPERKLIEFPRLFAFDPPAPSSDELAEPVVDRPRIMDVPEETEQIELPLGGISLDPAHEVAASQHIDVPFQVAAVSQRVFAGITDSVLIFVATAMFAGIVLNLTSGLPHNKLVLIIALIVPALFWTVYHYLFLVHAAKTPGMLMARIRLATFDGTATNRNIRRARALAMLISALSAGLGFLWAVVDEDTLCWHDKISRTYLANR